MTLEEIKALDREYLLPREVAEVLQCDVQGLRVWSRQRPEALGFPVTIIGSRIRIPRIPFLRHMGVDV